jgi:hypothetical protein
MVNALLDMLGALLGTSTPESRSGQRIVGCLCASGVIAVVVIIVLALSGRSDACLARVSARRDVALMSAPGRRRRLGELACTTWGLAVEWKLLFEAAGWHRGVIMYWIVDGPLLVVLIASGISWLVLMGRDFAPTQL